jgi:hypothetical protein
MARSNLRSASVLPLTDPLVRLLLPEKVYAASFLLDRIDPARISGKHVSLLEIAQWEIRHGDVREKTLERLAALQRAD